MFRLDSKRRQRGVGPTINNSKLLPVAREPNIKRRVFEQAASAKGPNESTITSLAFVPFVNTSTNIMRPLTGRLFAKTFSIDTDKEWNVQAGNG